jgi:hypothetical protein
VKILTAPRPGRISTQCIFAPDIPEELTRWGMHYQGDYDFIPETVDLHGGDSAIVWREEVVAWTRPTEAKDWTLR